jgi:hypothetical protein
MMSQAANFRQTLELSRGYKATEELLKACIIDENEFVQCAAKVTELTAETWAQAAQIYLWCRFYKNVQFF